MVKGLSAVRLEPLGCLQHKPPLTVASSEQKPPWPDLKPQWLLRRHPGHPCWLWLESFCPPPPDVTSKCSYPCVSSVVSVLKHRPMLHVFFPLCNVNGVVCYCPGAGDCGQPSKLYSFTPSPLTMGQLKPGHRFGCAGPFGYSICPPRASKPVVADGSMEQSLQGNLKSLQPLSRRLGQKDVECVCETTRLM